MPLTITLGRFHWSASWLMTLAALLCTATFVQLGRWQWHRAEGASNERAAYIRGTAAHPVALDDRATGALPRYSEVVAGGHYDGRHQFLLDNMTVRGEAGYEVLTPLQMRDGRWIVVNRGWVPLTASRRDLPDVQLPSAPASPEGRLDDLPVVGIALGHVPPAAGGHWPKVTSFPTMADLSAALGHPLEPRQLLLDPNQPHGFVRDWQPSDSGPVQHLSYAVQWWLFALITFGLYVYLNRSRRGPPPLRGPQALGTLVRSRRIAP